MSAPRPDLIILGGGLAGGLIALALAARRPEMRVTIVEAGETLGGNHLWSFFASDVDPADRALVEPLIVHRWPAYEVQFPAYVRTISEPYHTIESERFDAVVRSALPEGAVIRATVTAASPTGVTLDDGRTLSARAVIDTRGGGDLPGLVCGWQKFVGQLLILGRPHGVTLPVVMDATVAQADGYRFVYLLPLGADRIFIEDTYYGESPDLETGALTRRIAEYAAARGWQVNRVGRIESGVLPVVMRGSFERFWPARDRLARGGARAALFHPLTSFSLPDAVRFASWLSTLPDVEGETLGGYSRAFARRHWRSGGFYRMLAALLFGAAIPSRRYRLLEHFYRRPPPVIARFYAGRSSLWDRIRVLSGEPPVPLVRAARVLMERR